MVYDARMYVALVYDHCIVDGAEAWRSGFLVHDKPAT